ncbi:HAD-IIIC family phosphatase [Campylobacter taeniopygiae]|uniref:HAD-IIIC family phosphatase n=1 Tax=Campylobacter taeniopygiae TaxID=2510188 RepID=UPI003D6A22B1
MNLFSHNLKRNELIKYSKELNFSKSQEIIINIHRNHAFEGISSVITPFLHFSNLQAKFNFSAYDDSFNFTKESFSKKADLEILWVDLNRYDVNVQDFFKEKILELKNISQSPILCIFLGENINLELSNCQIFSAEKLLKDYFNLEDILDLEKEEMSGTKLNSKALICLAQILGLSLIPALLKSALKAIVLDLDNTLYEGVLGEDGIENLRITPVHKNLQEKIQDFKKQGFLLALASKNEENDTKKLFETRKDFILKWDDFDAKMINWEAKGENIVKIAKKFNIGTDAMLFIDDNIAELENVKYTGVKTLLADENILSKIKLYPNLLKFQNTQEDKIRAKDIAANALREELKTLSDEEYFKNLKICLKFSKNDTENITRISELLGKTNQFIANYTRLNLEEVANYMKKSLIINISMSDKLSDSGIIAIFLFSLEQNKIFIDDLCISCRALGRKLEERMFFKAFEMAINFFNISKNTPVTLYYKKGDRNTPFLNFLEKISSKIKENQALIDFKKLNFQGLTIFES